MALLTAGDRTGGHGKRVEDAGREGSKAKWGNPNENPNRT